MKINRNNCEAWFLDYYEGNLSDGQVRELFAFLEQHADLRELFDSYEEVSFDPEKQVRFDGKDALKKTSEIASGVNESNYEAFIVGAVEGTLSPDETKQLEQFLAEHPSKKEELELLRQTIFEADAEIVFDAKESLKKTALVTEENFAEYAVAFNDGELSGETLKQFELFVAAHPAMQRELELLAKTKLRPETEIVFEDKASLRRKLLVVTEENFDELAVASVEGTLNGAEAKTFAAYLAANPAQQAAMKIYAQTKLQPDTAIVFEEKESLKRKARGAFWWVSDLRFAAAAAVLLFVGILWFNRGSDVAPKTDIASNQPVKNNHPSDSLKNNTVVPDDHLQPNEENGSPKLASTNVQQPDPVQVQPKETPRSIANTRMKLLDKNNAKPVLTASVNELAVAGTTPAPSHTKSITPTQYAMRWTKKQLDRHPNQDEEEAVSSAIAANNEDQDVSGFDLTSSAVNRLGEATGANLHLGKNSEGTVLTIGKYDILLNRNK